MHRKTEEILNRTKIYFVSDAHFGVDSQFTTKQREKFFVEWLDAIKVDASELYLLGDIFDFWFEYSYVVPRGFVIVLAKLRELADAGVKIKYFTGNHDMWVFDYLPEVIGAELHTVPELREIDGKKFYIAHGDGLGKYDRKYNLMKGMFHNRFFQFMFKWIHPDWGCRFALWCSHRSRLKHDLPETPDYENEFLVMYSREVLKKEHFDYFVFGHRHIPYQYALDDSSLFTNIGDWLFNFSYAVYDGENISLQKHQVRNEE